MVFLARTRADLNDATVFTKARRGSRGFHFAPRMGTSLAYVEGALSKAIHSGAIGLGPRLATA